MAEDIDRFIQEQKTKLARERNDLQRESTRKITEDNSNNHTSLRNNGFKGNDPSTKGPVMDASKALPLDTHEDLRSKLAKERHEEYRKFLAEKEKRSAPRVRPQSPVDGSSLPIPSRDSAKQERARIARNKEYNDFLHTKSGATQRKPRLGNEDLSPSVSQRSGAFNPITGDVMSADRAAPTSLPNGYAHTGIPSNHPTSTTLPHDNAVDVQMRREAASQTPRPMLRDYDDRPPPGPRRGWGTPQQDYEELLHRKREEEARYRRFDDDFDYYPPRGTMRPSHSDPHLNRYHPEDDRYSRGRYDYYDQEYDRRRVRFSDERNVNDRGYPPPGNLRYAAPPVDRPPVDRPLMDRPPADQRDILNDRLTYDWNISRSGRSRTLPEMDRQPSNAHRAADYPDSKPPRAKSASLPADEGGMAIGNRDTASATRRKKEQYRRELEQQMKEAKENKKREKEQELHINASGTQDPAKRPSGLSFGTSGPTRTPVPQQPIPQQRRAGYQPSFLRQAYPNTQTGSLQPTVPSLGLEEAITKSHLNEAPMIENPFNLNNYPSAFGTISTDPYMYYGIRNPLDPDPAEFASHLMQRPLPQNTMYPSNFTAGKTGVALDDASQENLSLVNASKAAQIRGESSIKNFVGDANLSPRSLTDPKSYQAILKQQMEEKERKKKQEKEEKERYDAKLEAQAAEYNPWGKGGGGAPMRDNTGKIVADLRKLHHHNEQALNDPGNKNLQLFADQSPPLDTVNVGSSPWTGAIDQPTSTQPSTTAAMPKDPKAEYKEYLRQQVEEKKQREAALKEKIRQEEEREEKRLAEQRVKMQRDFEIEQQRLKEKEEEKQRQKELLERQLEEQKKEVEKKKHDAIEARRREGEEANRTTQEQEKTEQDRSSPPIPTLRNKENPPRQSSPPIPTLRKKTQDEKKTDKPSASVHPQVLENNASNSKPDHNISSPWKELSMDPPQKDLKHESDSDALENTESPDQKIEQGKAVDRSQLPPENPKEFPLLSQEKPLSPSTTDGDKMADGKQANESHPGRVKEKNGNDFELENWLQSIDPDLVAYAPALSENGYKTAKAIRRISRHTLLQFCPDMKHGHVEALLHEVERIQTPVSSKLLQEEKKRENKKPLIDLLSDEDSLSDIEMTNEQEGGSKDRSDSSGRDPRDVMSALSVMRRQLHSEQRRIQSQLDRNKEHDPYSSVSKAPPRRTTPQVDVFEIARHKAPVAVRREPLTHHAAATDFSKLKNRESNSRHKLLEQFPGLPNSDLTLEAQQRALLRHQQEKLDNLRKGKVKRPLDEQMPSLNPRDLGQNDSPLLALESESAFIGINNGIADIPNTPPHRKRPPSPRRDYGEPSTSQAAQNKSKNPLGSTMSFDNDTLDYLAQKNKDRNRVLRQLEGDNSSLVDPDDVLQRFMKRGLHDRPKSGKSEDLSLWLQPTVSDY